MMVYQPLELGLMQQCGSSLRKALQNESMWPLDLLVREAVQNSLDAARSDVPVEVDFTIRGHSSAAVGEVLGACEVARVLGHRFVRPARMLEVRDRGTQGLSGPLRIEDVPRGGAHGNLLKLVYEVGRTQQDERAGGSWGLGKTIFFRLGVGLVFYYSRFREESGGYAERLAACLVEDESSPERLQQDSLTGIAWWGAATSGPLTEVAAIREVLAALGVEPFGELESGTSVIIPFLREDLGPSVGAGAAEREPTDAAEAGPGQTAVAPWWWAEDADYLRVALQRWYCVRIANADFVGGPPLNASVNGEAITRSSMLPVFQLVQRLYLHAVGVAGRLSRPDEVIDASNLRREPISLNAVLAGNTAVGTLVMARADSALLAMTPPDNQPSPHWAVHGAAVDPPFRPIIGFIRGPGMIVRWDDRTDRSGWLDDVGGFEDAYLVALFVPHSEGELKAQLRQRLGDGTRTLGAYLRRCELADHLQWSDINGLSVVNRIRNGVVRQMRRWCAPPPTTGRAEHPLRAARVLADRLLPRGFGADGRHGVTSPVVPRPSPNGARGARGVGEVYVEGMRHLAGAVEVDWHFIWGRDPAARELSVLVDSESDPLDYAQWLAQAAGAYPFRIARIDAGVRPIGGPHGVDVPWVSVAISDDGSCATLCLVGVPSPATVVEGTVRIAVGPPQGAAVQATIRCRAVGAGSEA